MLDKFKNEIKINHFVITESKKIVCKVLDFKNGFVILEYKGKEYKQHPEMLICHTPTFLIGIDPDIDKSGFAVALDGKIAELHNFTVPQINEYLTLYKDQITKVVIESGWEIKKSNWHHLDKKMSMAQRESIARKVGENHGTGKIILQFVEHLGLNYQLLNPLGKIKKDDHSSAADKFNRITGWSGNSNPETRDAAMLVHGRMK